MENYPKPVTKQCTKKIYDQMENSFYKIIDKDGNFGIGIFCYIKNIDKNIPAIIINNPKIDEKHHNIINISKGKNNTKIQLLNRRYINKECNIIILEIKEHKEYKIDYIEIDDQLFNKEYENYYYNKSIYIIQYEDHNDISVSYGVIKNILSSQIRYASNINTNSKCSFIFNLSNNKLIGLHENNNNNSYYNKGQLLNIMIKEFLREVKNDINENEIDILIKVEDINKEIYFLDNEDEDENGNKLYHSNLKELNELNTELYINDIKEQKYEKYFIPSNVGEYKIKLKFNVNLTDSSYMFAGCDNIININFISFNTKYITNMNHMFYRCINSKN